MQTKTYISDEILRMEPDEALEKLADAEKMCKVFVNVYDDRRKNLASYFKDGPVVEWDFQSTIIFTRFDKFMAKIRQLQARFISLILPVIKHISLHRSISILLWSLTSWRRLSMAGPRDRHSVKRQSKCLLVLLNSPSISSRRAVTHWTLQMM